MLAAATWDSWVWWGMGWTLAAGAAVVLLLALFRDRARGRLRCGRCWYDMSGAEELTPPTCPECGRVAAGERALRRTRRHWTWAIAAVAIGLFGWQLTAPRRDGEGWTRIVPTRALKLAALVTNGWAEDPVRPIIFSREIGGSATALAAWMELTMDEAGAWRAVRTRAKWPKGEVARAMFDDVSAATPVTAFWSLVAARRDDPELSMERLLHPPTARISRLTWRPNDGDEEIVLALRGLGRHRERMVVSIECDGSTIGQWNVDVEYEVVASLNEAVRPMDSPELREKIRRSLRARESRSPERASFDLVAGESVAGLGSLHVQGDVLLDGRVVGKLVNGGFAVEPLWALGEGGAEPGVVVALSGELREFPFDAVTLRVTGDQRAALQDFYAEGYWSGTMEISLKELLRLWDR